MDASIQVIVRVRPASSPFSSSSSSSSSTSASASALASASSRSSTAIGQHALQAGGPVDFSPSDALASSHRLDSADETEGRWITSSNSIYFQPPSFAPGPVSPAHAAFAMPSSSERQPLASVFTFDQVFGPTSQTREIYRASASDIVDMTLEGINGTIFAYGQTSSGKTYTMQGSPSEPGIITMAMQDIFEKISQSAKCYVVKASYLEIYNENIKDLLLPGNENLKIHEHFSRGVHVGGLTELTVKSCAEVIALMNKGEINRHVGETNMNERSSRSHTILRIYIESRDVSEDVRSVKVSCLNLVDLAGSERASHTGAEGLRLKEGGSINKSLLALATVIARLSDGGDRGHIPYRDSKITRILQPSLGGNARTLIICTVTPSPRFVEDTISTLKFASRAKTIQNKPTVNEFISDTTLIKRYQQEIRFLKSEIDELRSRTVPGESLSARVADSTVDSRANETDGLGAMNEDVLQSSALNELKNARESIKALLYSIVWIRQNNRKIFGGLRAVLKSSQEKSSIIQKSQQMAEHLKALEYSNASMLKELERERSSRNELEKKLQRSSSLFTDKIVQSERELAHLRSELGRETARSQMLREDVEVAKKEDDLKFQKLRTENEAHLETIKRLEMEKHLKASRVDLSTDDEIRRARLETSQLTAALATALEEKSKAKEDVERLKFCLSDVERRLKDDLEAVNAMKDAEILALSSRLNESAVALSELRSEHLSLSTSLHSCERRMSAMEAEYAEKLAEKTLQLQELAVSEKRQRKEADILKQYALNEKLELEMQLSHLEEMNDTLRADLLQAKENFEEETKEHNETLADFKSKGEAFLRSIPKSLNLTDGEGKAFSQCIELFLRGCENESYEELAALQALKVSEDNRQKEEQKATLAALCKLQDESNRYRNAAEAAVSCRLTLENRIVELESARRSDFDSFRRFCKALKNSVSAPCSEADDHRGSMVELWSDEMSGPEDESNRELALAKFLTNIKQLMSAMISEAEESSQVPLRQEIAKLLSAASRMEKDLDALNGKLIAAHSSLSNARKTEAALEATVQSLEEKLREQQKGIDTGESKYQSELKKSAKLGAQLARIEKDYEELAAANHELEELRKQLQAQINLKRPVVADHSDCENERKEMLNIFEELRSNLEKSNREKEDMQRKFNAVMEEYDVNMQSLQETNQQLAMNEENLHLRIADMQNELEDTKALEALVSQLSPAMDSLTSNALKGEGDEEPRSILSEIDDRYKEERRRYAGLEDKYAKMSKFFNVVLRERKCLMMELQNLRSRGDEQSDKLVKMQNELIHQLRSELQAMVLQKTRPSGFPEEDLAVLAASGKSDQMIDVLTFRNKQLELENANLRRENASLEIMKLNAVSTLYTATSAMERKERTQGETKGKSDSALKRPYPTAEAERSFANGAEAEKENESAIQEMVPADSSGGMEKSARKRRNPIHKPFSQRSNISGKEQ